VAGLVAVCLASIGSMALPVTAIRTLSVLENVSLYGGLAVFSGLVLYDTQKIIAHAENPHGTRPLSPINDSIGIYLDFINIFIRMLTIMGKQQRK
jgi:FtsH-binding integral membrane protein